MEEQGNGFLVFGVWCLGERCAGIRWLRRSWQDGKTDETDFCGCKRIFLMA
jgi:hypothetical protein